jgi:hypothetical protein
MVIDRRFGVLGCLCLSVTGCFSYGHYPPPNAYLPPQSAMIPRDTGAVQLPPGTVWVPSSPTGAAAPANRVIVPDPAHADDSETATPAAEPSRGGSVPEPIDAGKPATETPVDSFGYEDDSPRLPPLARVGQLPRPRPRPLMEEDSQTVSNRTELPPQDSELAEITSERLNSDSNLRTAEFTTQVRSAGVSPTAAKADRYGYDTENYSWLKGIAEYDAKQKVWHLTYSLTPDETDKFGGEVTLKNTAHFQYLRSGEPVRVEGNFDPVQRDRLGKPVYEVIRMFRDTQR